jgi:hypothetical protein
MERQKTVSVVPQILVNVVTIHDVDFVKCPVMRDRFCLTAMSSFSKVEPRSLASRRAARELVKL